MISPGKRRSAVVTIRSHSTNSLRPSLFSHIINLGLFEQSSVHRLLLLTAFCRAPHRTTIYTIHLVIPDCSKISAPCPHLLPEPIRAPLLFNGGHAFCCTLIPEVRHSHRHLFAQTRAWPGQTVYSSGQNHTPPAMRFSNSLPRRTALLIMAAAHFGHLHADALLQTFCSSENTGSVSATCKYNSTVYPDWFTHAYIRL